MGVAAMVVVVVVVIVATDVPAEERKAVCSIVVSPVTMAAWCVSPVAPVALVPPVPVAPKYPACLQLGRGQSRLALTVFVKTNRDDSAREGSTT